MDTEYYNNKYYKWKRRLERPKTNGWSGLLQSLSSSLSQVTWRICTKNRSQHQLRQTMSSKAIFFKMNTTLPEENIKWIWIKSSGLTPITILQFHSMSRVSSHHTTLKLRVFPCIKEPRTLSIYRQNQISKLKTQLSHRIPYTIVNFNCYPLLKPSQVRSNLQRSRLELALLF